MNSEFNPEDPNQYTQQLAEYFNLEFFGWSDDGYPEGFEPSDFTYAGVHQVNALPVMFWRVKNERICATVEPFEQTVCLGMDYFPGEGEE